MQKSLRTLTALAACVFTVLTPALAAAAPAATQGSSVLDLNPVSYTHLTLPTTPYV